MTSLLVISSEKEAVATSKRKSVGLLCLDDLVDVRIEGTHLGHFDKFTAPLDPDDVDEALVLAKDDGFIIDERDCEHEALRHQFIENIEVDCVHQIEHLLFGADKNKVFVYETAPHVLNIECLNL